MRSQSSTGKWRGALGLFAIAAVIVALLVWECRGRPSLSCKPEYPSNEVATKAEVFKKLCEGKTLAGERRHAEAVAVFDEIVRTETDPNSAYRWDADIQAAHSMGYLGQHDKAMARFDQIIADCPLAEEIRKAELAKADVHSLAGQHDVAIKMFERLLVEYTDISPLTCERALKGARIAYMRTHQPGLVRSVLARFITDYPGAENIIRKWAKKEIVTWREQHRKLQQPTIDQLLANKRAKKVDNLPAGLTTWTADDGPYLVTQPLAVGSDATLRIEAGTQVRFGVLGGLKVKGRLEVSGTADKPVRLVPLSDDPTRDWWAGLEVTGGKGEDASRLSHCLILGTEIAVHARGGRVELDHCKFDRCGRVSVLAAGGTRLKMDHCEVTGGYRIGVECEPRAALQMTDCKITGLTTHGVVLKEVSGGSVIRQTRIERCGWDGILVRGKCSPKIEGCQIRGNGGNGISAIEGASPTVVNTPLENNAGAGIRLEERWEAAISGNTIVGNRGGGILANVRCNGEIADNLFANNGQAGLLLRLDCAPAVTGNRFLENNGPGLLLQNSQPRTLRDNQFLDNAGAALRNEGSGSVQAAGNWWGSTNEEEIAKMIQDRRVNPAWGEVRFRPWLSKAPASQHSASPRSKETA